MTQVLTYKYRLLPTKRQHQVLAQILEQQRQLYNAALQERIEAYRRIGKSLTYFDQCNSLTICRRDLPEMANLPLKMQRGTLHRLDLVFKGFFNRVKKGNNPGFPRFKSRYRWKSFEFAEFSGILLKGSRLRFKGMPSSLRVHLHRVLPKGKILNAKFKRDIKGWFICLAIRIEVLNKLTISSAVGVDLGIKVLAALSDGRMIPNPHIARKTEKIMRCKQRQLSRCQRGSKRRTKIKSQVGRFYRKIAATRSTYLHQVSASLVQTYNLIAVEDLNIKGLAKSKLARDVHDAAWAKLIYFLTYKAERAGTHLILVDPKYTSQDCSCCGNRVKKNLSVRMHSCTQCGLILDRDTNAAKNILDRAVVRPR